MPFRPHAGLTADDVELEVAIFEAFEALVNATDTAGRHLAFGAMRSLVLRRSPAAVRRLEQVLGLDRRP